MEDFCGLGLGLDGPGLGLGLDGPGLGLSLASANFRRSWSWFLKGSGLGLGLGLEKKVLALVLRKSSWSHHCKNCTIYKEQ